MLTYRRMPGFWGGIWNARNAEGDGHGDRSRHKVTVCRGGTPGGDRREEQRVRTGRPADQPGGHGGERGLSHPHRRHRQPEHAGAPRPAARRNRRGREKSPGRLCRGAQRAGQGPGRLPRESGQGQFSAEIQRHAPALQRADDRLPQLCLSPCRRRKAALFFERQGCRETAPGPGGGDRPGGRPGIQYRPRPRLADGPLGERRHLVGTLRFAGKGARCGANPDGGRTPQGRGAGAQEIRDCRRQFRHRRGRGVLPVQEAAVRRGGKRRAT